MKKLQFKLCACAMAFLLSLFFAGCDNGGGGGGGERAMTPGSITVEADGFYLGSTFDVTVIVDQRRILDIIPRGLNTTNQTNAVGMVAIPPLIDRILEAQSVEVDTVSGATITSLNFLFAVEEALIQAGAPSRMFASTPRPPVDVTENIDILVMGGGVAGLSAAIAAKDANPDLTVVVIDKSEITGGSSRFSAGFFYIPLADTPAARESLFQYQYLMSERYLSETMVRYWVNNSWDSVRFIYGWPAGSVFPMGAAVGPARQGRMRNFPGTVAGGPGAGNVMVDHMITRARNAGVIIMTGVRGTELIQLGALGTAITGAKAESRARNINYTFNVRHGVIIATGGYTHNQRLMDLHHPGFSLSGASSTHDGSGIEMAEAKGAATLFRGGLPATFAIPGFTQPPLHLETPSNITIASDGSFMSFPDEYGYVFPPRPLGQRNYAGYEITKVLPGVQLTELLANLNDGILLPVNQLNAVTLTRFMRPHFILEALRRNPQMQFWSLGRGTPAPSHVAAGLVTIASDPAALLEQLNQERVNIEGMTVADLETAFSYMAENTGDYFAVRVVPSAIAAMGGLMTNTNGQVLRGTHTIGNTDYDDVIPGLYAAGEVAFGQFFYLVYPSSGTALSLAATFGVAAGRHAAANPR